MNPTNRLKLLKIGALVRVSVRRVCVSLAGVNRDLPLVHQVLELRHALWCDEVRWTAVRLVKSRWKIERDYQQLREELGLDHYEGRTWTDWHPHINPVTLARAFFTIGGLNFWVDPSTDAP
ncbi:MAG: hypothetical protein KGM47_09940 [Acidobacteriota bacterium]|nr:hypothetical protein [Acidobacteriota bacterium]